MVLIFYLKLLLKFKIKEFFLLLIVNTDIRETHIIVNQYIYRSDRIFH